MVEVSVANGAGNWSFDEGTSDGTKYSTLCSTTQV
jgi:hypothetical protein